MARKTVLISDLSGNDIAEPVRVTLHYGDGRRGVVVLDVDASEVEELSSKGTIQKRRGRKPKVAAAA